MTRVKTREQGPLWAPSPEGIEEANITRFARQAIRDWGLGLNDYPSFYRWSIERPEEFWQSVWKFGNVIASDRGERALADADRMPGARFFPDAKLNFAENLLRRRDEATALVFWGENKVKRRVSHRELFDLVARLARALRDMQVGPGDRVASYLPNLPEAIAAMLATASVGAIWSSCSPDFGVQGVLDRFGQIGPKVLFAADGFHFNGRAHDSLGRLRDISPRLPDLERVVVVPYLCDRPQVAGIRNAVTLEEFAPRGETPQLVFEQLPFNHPLYILYSSGTTGVPKCIVHGAGGTLLKHLEEHLLQCDLRPGDRLFYFTTLGWMMWNWLASGLASGATLLLYDGSPFMNRGRILFDYADAEGMTHFGTSARFIDAIHKTGLEPCQSHKLERLRFLLSTGSPLMAEGFDYVYRSVKKDICLASIAGGTDIVGCFVGGNPILPVRRGEIQAPMLGMKVEVYGEDGRPVVGQKGELVCSAPFPSMPVGFWNDPDGSKYHAAYFEDFPDVWTHGDWAEITAHGGVVIYGRSDTVLKPGGVRIGTAEIYRQVEQLDEVVESIVIGQAWPPGRLTDVRVVLFVRLREGLTLDVDLIRKIRDTIRGNTTPSHVPAKVLQVPEIPRTKSGKIVELAVREVVHGHTVKNIEALDNPESLEHYRNRPELET